MSTNDTASETSPTTHGFAFLNATTELVPLSTVANVEKSDSLSIIVALICIFLLLATCLIFVTLYKPAALDRSCHGPQECLPHHPEDASEPQLKLWKRLGLLRYSICTSVRRSHPSSQAKETSLRKISVNQDWIIMESTEM